MNHENFIKDYEALRLQSAMYLKEVKIARKASNRIFLSSATSNSLSIKG